MAEAETKLIEGATGSWEVIIGIECHAQVASNSKLFSGAATEFGAEPNSQVSLVDAAMPGMLPVLNEYCVEQAVRTGLGLGSAINKRSVFARKNYFYPDLPQGYQISQFELPIVGEGEVILDLAEGIQRTVGIERLHLEQDAGKSIHDQDPSLSFVDLNRSGVALMEIVSKPDMRSAEEAQAFLKKLRTIVRYLGTCDGNMEQGSMRGDINVSVRRPGEPLGTRAEIKNVNSFRFVGQAVDYEVGRQIDLIEDGGEVVQETRLFDPRSGETRSMRSKEEAHDYRYFPDPDLLPLVLTDEFIEGIRATLPEMPDQKKARFVEQFGLKPYDAGVLAGDKASSDFFEKVAEGREARLVANWVTGEFFGSLNKLGVEIEDSPISADDLGELIDLISDDTISGRIAKDVFEIMLETGDAPGKIVEEKGLKQVTDTGAIEAIVDEVIAQNPDKVAEVKEKPKLAGWFVGQVMKASQGKANPAAVNKILAEKLGL
ncbi:Aspartyl-tRNA(Asn) amidotransferase subunit B @ Glutamyl-tRNA(Gln) amidotransferase subunit B [Candidatus Phaeomarinobacter ectocarpi]|uniref:Aspartyl/glutamyl-tRNA(Asn/Gln) amidotransferase subunit B n=1 Tax=Candidatus Phaeomarinibacter ectocarpi TaxID=1458461 RepID=X5MHV1_9HYPH|nr:Asp-tRNA(Asn)/Glu-tRNA(Gln) amidotransferase subunit GatB [Candidatus Phaeomarinobacter ectocarpi]CDO61419.1 Aspartyl-tRNA(Asn) amidotransferase subunit B @ Glutamyl-tRNA(Gln) amidotransferase subunit B [Candidatus Phaeomarinobacter ectocarpi]